MIDDYLQPADIATILAVSPKKVHKWIRTGAMKASNLNDNPTRPRWIIRREDLDTFVKSRQPEPKRPTPRRAAIPSSPTDRY